MTTATRLLHHLLCVGNEISACKGPGGMVARKGSKDEGKKVRDLTAMQRARSGAALAKQQHASAIEAAVA